MTYKLDIPIYCKYLSRKYAHFVLYLESPGFPSKEQVVRKLTWKLDIRHFGLIEEEVLDAVKSVTICDWPENGDRKHHNCNIVRKEFGRQKLSIDEIVIHNINDGANYAS